jgi:hypothetical protein
LIQVLAPLPNFSAEQISVAIEGCMAFILACAMSPEEIAAENSFLDDSRGVSASLARECGMAHRSPQRRVEFFTVIELPEEVDSARSVAVFAEGVLAIRMSKSPAA